MRLEQLISRLNYIIIIFKYSVVLNRKEGLTEEEAVKDVTATSFLLP